MANEFSFQRAGRETVVSGAPSHEVRQFGWLVTNFTRRTSGVAHAVVVSVDGFLLAASDRLPPERAEQFAAIASGLLSLADGAARCFDAGAVRQTAVDMEGGTMLLMSISDGSCLSALAAPGSDLGVVAYEMSQLVHQVGQMLTPELRAELQQTSQAALGRAV